MEKQLPIFLGVCHKALLRFEGLVQDLYGVTDYLAVHFFPLSLGDLVLLMAFPKEFVSAPEHAQIMLKNPKTGEKAFYNMYARIYTIEGDQVQINVAHVDKPYTKDKVTQEYVGSRVMISQYNPFKMMSVPCPNLFLGEPSDIDLYYHVCDKENKLGTITCRFVPPPPMTESERNALMSQPNVLNVVVIRVMCKKCKDTAHFHLSLDGVSKPSEEDTDSVLITNAPDMWECSCGQHKIPLCYLKQGMHTLFRTLPLSGAKKRLGIIPLYEKSSISSMLSEYQIMLIEQFEENEEIFQQYLQDHPLFWNFLAPLRIWHKPPILTKYNADFAILTRMRVLYFVEIEKPKTTLIKADGGVHSELQAGLDQIRNWKIEIDKRREAVLSGLDLEQKEVHEIGYIVVAGLANKTGTSGMEKIRKMITDADFIFCFDELASFLHSTVTALAEL